jgi:NAD(P)H-hydrate epimerase
MRKPPSLTAARIRMLLPKRPEDAHKGLNGHVLIVAGSRGMSGAAALCARGALRIGAGLVTAAIVDSEREVVTRQLPEALTLGLPETWEGVLTENSLPVLEEHAAKRKINVLAVGPGLSIGAGVARVVKALVEDWDMPLVLDADGLNNMNVTHLRYRRDLVITPHVGELARLLKVETDAIQDNPVVKAQEIAHSCRLICVLKGHPTIISDGSRTVLNPTGNPAMATGGMGDILTGAISGLIAQGLSAWDAACAGVYLHGLAADLIKTSDRGLLASDVADALPRALSKIGVK